MVNNQNVLYKFNKLNLFLCQDKVYVHNLLISLQDLSFSHLSFCWVIILYNQ